MNSDITIGEMLQTLILLLAWREGEQNTRRVITSKDLEDEKIPKVKCTEPYTTSQRYISGGGTYSSMVLNEVRAGGLMYEEGLSLLSLGKHISRIDEYRTEVAGFKYIPLAYLMNKSISKHKEQTEIRNIKGK